MQFYKFEGITVNKQWSEDNNDRRIMKERTIKISLNSNAFNYTLKNEAYFYVCGVDGDLVKIGIICRDADALDKSISSYLQAVGLELRDTVLEEITLSATRVMLQRASRLNFIEDDDQVLEQFGLDKLSFTRGFEYGENMIDKTTKKTAYAEAEKYSVGASLVPELDRIYAGKKTARAMGHPVHYMVQTDDRDTRNGMYRLLLQALYANGRLQSRRYVYVDFKPGDNFSKTVYDCLYMSCIGGAVVVRFLADDDSEDDRASGARDTVERICEIMQKYRNQVLTVFCLPRECTKVKEMFYENSGVTNFVELKEEFVSGRQAERYLKMLARESGVRANKKLLGALEEGMDYLTPDLHRLFDTWYNNKLKTEIYPQYRDVATARKEAAKAANRGSAYDELTDMIGLDEAKKVIHQALNYYKAQKLFADRGMKADRPAMHMVFTGNPGTAKTSVARLFARIMKDNEILSKGKLVEVGRGDLVGKYVGWTAPIIQQKFREAQGSVLFIDEAYSLVDDRNGSYGDEAINTIVQEMENHRDDVVVIFAGYPDKMEKFLNKNPGLRSRIAFHVPFADYTTPELCDIAKLIARKNELIFTEGAKEKLAAVFDEARAQTDFGNGRFVRNTIERAIMAQATRLMEMDNEEVSRNDIRTICAEDIEIPAAANSNVRRSIGFC